MFVFDHQIRVRYAETDQMGYVYYGNYAAFYEIARTEMLRSTGISYRELEEMGVMLPVAEMKTKYLKPGKYDDLITIRVTIRQKPAVRIIFEYELFNESGELLNQGETTLVFVNMEKNRPCMPPQVFLDKMSKYFN
ncbi:MULTISPECIES: thioesterase family protein [Sphingobacterium]|uniref:Acyl-CoA thioesterase n=1 Tax=Sphingobacterium paramultivorum TaxID=2886510 RepID=A0A7G5E4P3_9SPHI|nr:MULTISPECIES: thioesterase family protein [Sphingobacterium]MBB1645192.1 thioesterase [Sphingobacterium sp. UME9]MCS4165489.1 acyl-CoA thioester hydrolase [Sphingobacterium sp. BIGb0116]QMV68968.1 acyl-CoA thioesterase [Sphingobacterium paramultivorum]WET69968.1 MAG: thioesterase family protein [Sphingobacterium sp.]WSO12744.1 thioesterase family protein [Sphingobacterium paramultivorum]